MLLAEQKYNLEQKRGGIENGKSHTQIQKDEPCASDRIRIAI